MNTTDISLRILGSSSKLTDTNDKINFGYFRKSDLSKIADKLDEKSKTAFYINTSISNDTGSESIWFKLLIKIN